MDRNPEPLDIFKKLLEVTEKISHIKDLDALMDRILTEARQFTSADAGSIYLVEGEKLRFGYVQNASLFTKMATDSNKYLYLNQELSITDKSIVGYVTLTGKPVIIEDAYRIPAEFPYTFNPSFDQQISYRTQSILTVPLKTSREIVVGVLQIINKINTNDQVIPFSDEDLLCVEYLASQVAVVIERAQMTREIFLRMIRMAELRDPFETGAHVNRVATYSIEIYRKWANIRGIREEEVKRFRDNLRIAAMLHDVGKVGISDTILKKPAKLTESEFTIVKLHTIFGSRLFQNATSDLDIMSAEVCLNHHEKWNGTGYPGEFEEKDGEIIFTNKKKKGKEIPLAARIVSLADVYDALHSKRAYKDAWPEEKVLQLIQEEKGKQFDPELVDSFFVIRDIIHSIQKKYQDKEK
ncbi:MAG: HD domain-containing phosphohydrolase [Candidatus Omnitrophota bacterium]